MVSALVAVVVLFCAFHKLCCSATTWPTNLCSLGKPGMLAVCPPIPITGTTKNAPPARPPERRPLDKSA